MTAIGAGLGLAGAIGVGRVAQSVLYELKGNDISVFALSGLVLSAIALLAGFVPAHRASRIDSDAGASILVAPGYRASNRFTR